jgi:N-acetylmuramoyl-L-alanine amidase
MFTIVIDAGHGGIDAGAPGAKTNEKTINLSVSLKLGDLISKNQSDVKVVYTRKTDCFIGLDERASIANRNKADLFISIHANGVKNAKHVLGTETFTLGLARSKENLEVAMRENSAILLEDNYQQTYEDFDPNSTESYIIFEFMQNRHMEQSINLASKIQKAFKEAKRDDRGVKQAGLLVLRKISMPGVLVELGFMTNPEEERFMKSTDGQNKLAKAIYNAFVAYKHDYDKRQSMPTATMPKAGKKPDAASPQKSPTTVRSSTASSNAASPATRQSDNKTEVYKVQIITSKIKLPANAKELKGYKNVSFYEENGLYKYTYGESSDQDSVKSTLKKTRGDFKDAFIVIFKNGEKQKTDK